MSTPDRILYAYAVVPAAAAVPAVPGVLPGAPPERIAAGDLAILASRVPRDDFAGEASRMADPAWVAERAAAHHAVVAAAFAAGPVLPLAFGALFSTEAALRRWLEGSAPLLAAALATAAGAEEWSVSLKEDAAAHAAFLTATEPALQALAAAAARAPQGTAFLLERRLDRAVQGARADRRAWLGRAIGAALTAAARAPLEVLPAAGAREARWTGLVPAGAMAGGPLAAGLAALAADVASSGLGLAISGPRPPYAFARGALSRQKAATEGLRHAG
jgi:hypothetical protein